MILEVTGPALSIYIRQLGGTVKSVIFTLGIFCILFFAFTVRAQDEPATQPGATAAPAQPGTAAGGTAEAKESLVSGGAEVDLNSRYVWRGIAFSEGPALNPYVYLSIGDFTVSGWGNFLLTDQDKEFQGQFNEADIYAAYAFEKDAFSLEATYQHYYYPNTDWEDTGEVEIKLAYAFDDISVFTSHTLDVESISGAYFAELGLEAEHELSDTAKLEGGVYLGYGNADFNEAYIGPSIDALDVAGASLDVTWYPVKNIYLRPHVEYTSLLHDDLRQAVESPDLVNVGLAAGVEF